MATSKKVETIAIVGAGVIGASWATHYLSKGFNVIATDPANAVLTWLFQRGSLTRGSL